MGGPGAWDERTTKAAEGIDRKQAEILAEIRQNGAGIVLG